MRVRAINLEITNPQRDGESIEESFENPFQGGQI